MFSPFLFPVLCMRPHLQRLHTAVLPKPSLFQSVDIGYLPEGGGKKLVEEPA